MKGWTEIFETPKKLKLYVMHTGHLHMSGNIHFNKGHSKTGSMPKDNEFNPVFAYLVEHPEKGLVLFDTGLHQSFAKSRFGNFGFLLGSMVKTRTSSGMDVISQIKTLGLDVGDVRTIVLSHLHLDHPSGLPNFKGISSCSVYVDGEELKAAMAPFSRLKGYIKSHLKDINLKTIQYNTSLAPFSQVCDLFGDSSILLVRTPGHTPGHISAVVNLEEGPMFLTFDAIHRKANLDEEIPPIGELPQALDSLMTIKQFIVGFEEIKSIYSHDREQLSNLKLLPEYYT